MPSYLRSFPLLAAMLLALLSPRVLLSGVSRPIQEKYRSNYENKALFLKIPIFQERQLVDITGKNFRAERGAGAARLKVGDQVRVMGIDFGGDEIKFRLSPITGAGLAEVVFKFDADLLEDFPNSDVFDRALEATFTEGLQYSDLEDAKRSYVEDQFESVVRELAATTGGSRESVLKAVAARVPAYQDSLREIGNLKSRNEELSQQLSQSQAEGRRLEADLKTQQSDAARLRSANASLQEKIDTSTAQLSRLGEDLSRAKGLTQDYQKELANLQRSLNLRVDSGRDLGSQISDLAQAMRKLQRDSESLTAQNNSLRDNLEEQRAANSRFVKENDELKASNQKMRQEISTLTSKEDSLARRYIQLKSAKEILEQASLAAKSLTTRIVEENVEGGYRQGKVHIYVRDVSVGSLDWRLPEALSPNDEKSAEVTFSADSIDYVRVAPEVREILRSLGDKLKVQVHLSSPLDTLQVQTERDEAVQEVGERDSGSWRWRILNRGTADARLLLAVQFINKNSDEVPVLEQESLVVSASVVRQVRNYLQPIPLIVGAVIGFIIFGISGVFRRTKTPRAPRPGPGTRAGDATPHGGRKQL